MVVFIDFPFFNLWNQKRFLTSFRLLRQSARIQHCQSFSSKPSFSLNFSVTLICEAHENASNLYFAQLKRMPMKSHLTSPQRCKRRRDSLSFHRTPRRIGEYAFYPVARDRPQDDSLSIPIILFLHTLSKVAQKKRFVIPADGFGRIELEAIFNGFPREVKVNKGIGPLHTLDPSG